MVLHKTLHIARNTFSKTLAHGYAQSVVAATQSSYASQNNSFGLTRFGKTQKHLYHNALSSSQKNAKDSHDGSLASYIAWHRAEKLCDKEWSQYQFPKALEYKPSGASAEKQAKAVENGAEQVSESASARVAVDRSYSDSVVDGLKHVIAGEQAEAEAEALARVDDAIAREIASGQELAAEVQEQGTSSVESSFVASIPTSDAEHSLQSSFSDVSVIEPTEAEVFARQLQNLAGNQNYAVIPAVFESMLSRGLTPTPAAYDALLTAVIHLPNSRAESVRKALDIYSDIIQRRVVPSLATYTTLVELLSTRAMEVVSLKNQLEEKRVRYGGLEDEGKFLFISTEREFQALANDKSLAEAIRMFAEAADVHAKQSLDERTYCYLVSACAEHGRMEDMVRIYSHMEQHNLVPRADTFVNMISAFASAGNVSDAVEAYNEYKEYAIAHNSGDLSMIRKDNDVYAAMVKAYTVLKMPDVASEFLQKLELTLSIEQLEKLRDVVALRAFVPEWLNQGFFEQALQLANERLTGPARDIGLKAVCIRAADRDQVEVATKAFHALSDKTDVSLPAMALGAMHVRNNDLQTAEQYWAWIETSHNTAALVKSTTMYAVGLISSGQADLGLSRARSVFNRIRSLSESRQTAEQIDEALMVISGFAMRRGISLHGFAAADLARAAIENGSPTYAMTSYILAGLGPEEINQVPVEDLKMFTQMQSILIVDAPHLDIAHSARFGHMVQMLLASGAPLDQQTEHAIDMALGKIDRPDVAAQWQHYKQPMAVSPYVGGYSSFQTSVGSPVSGSVSSFEDSCDPYAATTDGKGSAVIADLLERTHGNFSSHLREALTRFKNMRRLGRHPRLYTYGKLIAAAARDNNLQTAQEILAMARRDVPYAAQYRIVRHGWITILDAMVSACLTTGQRHLAEQFHEELLKMGAAPSANTFGQYITTLKEGTKTFDEATEAVNIFLRAKAEGVEPSSFLYNVLIGKLGKARRIDDCLFYYQEMRGLGIHPTSVTYGTIINALCRVSDEKLAEQLFEEMESMPNYKPRPAPYHSIMQYFLNTKRDRSKVLQYYDRMVSKHIEHTPYTYKLLIDTHATLEPIDMPAAEAVLAKLERSSTHPPDALHYASLIHAKGCVARDLPAARALFDKVMSNPSSTVRPQPSLFQALIESHVANHAVSSTPELLELMKQKRVEMTPYIANALIHGWSVEGAIAHAEEVYAAVPEAKREPSLYEAMTRAYVVCGDVEKAEGVVRQALGRGYPAAVQGKIVELLAGAQMGMGQA